MAPVTSLMQLVEQVSAKRILDAETPGPRGVPQPPPFPFAALVAQREMKVALLLALINPGVSGVLLVGPRGTGKTTAVRGLVNLLPQVPRSLCYYSCMPEDVEVGGIDSICPECAKKYA